MVFRLVEKWSFSLCTELRFPLLEACLTNKARITAVTVYCTKFEAEKMLKIGTFLFIFLPGWSISATLSLVSLTLNF